MVRKNLSVGLTPSLKQKLNPALFQQLKLLNLNYLELVTKIKQKLEENPFIEMEREKIEIKDKKEEKEENPEKLSSEELSILEDFFEHDDVQYYSKRKNPKEEDLLEKIVPSNESIQDKLKFHIRLDFDNPVDIIIGNYIIDNIDEKGFLALNEDDIKSYIKKLKTKKIKVDSDDFEIVRQKIMKMKPYGIASYDIKESLCLQAELKDIKNKKIIKKIIENDFEEFGHQNFKKISEKYNLSDKELKEITEDIKTLEPFPAELLSEIKTEFIVPDVIVTKEEGEYNVYLNDDSIPKINLSPYYRKIAKEMKWQRNKEAKYFRSKFEEAMNFIRSFDYRNSSLYKVAKAIVDRQKDFFEKGMEGIKPLRLKDVSETTELHETTVSRVVSNKYMISPSGIYKLSFFFSTSINKIGGENVSSKYVKAKIKKIVNNENKIKPLTDKKIAELLAEEGINISRRVIGKYRKSMDIPSSVKRKIK